MINIASNVTANNLEMSHYSRPPDHPHGSFDVTGVKTNSHYATDSVAKPNTQVEYPLRTRDGDDRDRSNRREKGSSGSTRNNSGKLRGPARIDRTSSIPLSNTVPEESKSTYIWGIKLPWSSTAAPVKRAPEVLSKSLHSSAMDLEGYFLQPFEDSMIHNVVEELKHSITSHVYNYYSGVANPPSEDVINNFINPDDDRWRAPMPPFSDESFRLASICLFIAQFMLERIAFDGDPKTTFLPAEVVSLLAMASSHHTERGEC